MLRTGIGDLQVRSAGVRAAGGSSGPASASSGRAASIAPAAVKWVSSALPRG
ncbi:hypothetical protein [Actinomadura geliboluensis]|uniref:hypothetical protein n=2 Tax=Actinomadura TaxID=1988 RepID=UPI0014868F72|nr:hypothetical protein [Actinomadura geliboluensis]